MKTKNVLRRTLAAVLVLSLAAVMVLCCGCNNGTETVATSLSDEETSSDATKKDLKEKYFDAACELIYNIPMYSSKDKHSAYGGNEGGKVSLGFEIIDLDGDDIPEIIYATLQGGAQAYLINNNVYYYKDGKYVSARGSGYSFFGVYPNRDTSGNLHFQSRLASLSSSGGKPNTYSGGWEYTFYEYKFTECTFQDKKASFEKIEGFDSYDVSKLSNEVWSGEKGEEYEKYATAYNAWYANYTPDLEYPYFMFDGISEAFRSPNSAMTEEEVLAVYHEEMTPELARWIVEQYDGEYHYGNLNMYTLVSNNDVENALRIEVEWTDPCANMEITLAAIPGSELRSTPVYNVEYGHPNAVVMCYDDNRNAVAYAERRLLKTRITILDENIVCEVRTGDKLYLTNENHSDSMNAIKDRGVVATVSKNGKELWSPTPPTPTRHDTGYWDGIICRIDNGNIEQG